MLSFAKLLLLIAVVVGVFYGARLVGQMRKRAPGQQRRTEDRRNADAGPRKRITAEDMAECPVCGIYVTPGGARCGKPGCPQG